MLQQISVKNFALIEELNLEFDPGFNVLTGETGAGKSIIIDALGLALGGRFSSEMIRAGAESATVEAVFDNVQYSELATVLDEAGIPIDSDNTLIIQREINTSGKNRCRINGQLVTVLTLHKVGEYLVDIHGQHEHQSLLFSEKQLELLDGYAGNECITLRRNLGDIYRKWQSFRNEYLELKQNETDKARRLDLLKYQLEEIEKTKLVIGEDEDLAKEREILSASEKLYEAAAVSYQALYENNSGKAALELLAEAERALMQAADIDERLQKILENLKETACQAEEISRELRSYQERVQFDPERLTLIEDRLDEIGRLKRKYGPTVAEILLFAEKCSNELTNINSQEQRTGELERVLDEFCLELGRLAEQLSSRRQQSAESLEKAIVEQLADLNMAKTQFKINFVQTESVDGIPFGGKKVDASANGADKIDFLVAPNPGETLKPLTKIASGGELSRMMLALKAILAELDQIPTMVFDEIDVGIGGRTAQAVAEKILFIGQARQVICITHLPQIASMAKRHFYIEKQVIEERTRVYVRELMVNERIEELARMLGGAQVTETTREHAREMLTMAERLRLYKVGQMN